MSDTIHGTESLSCGNFKTKDNVTRKFLLQLRSSSTSHNRAFFLELYWLSMYVNNNLPAVFPKLHPLVSLLACASTAKKYQV